MKVVRTSWINTSYVQSSNVSSLREGETVQICAAGLRSQFLSLPVGEILAPSALISAENFVGYFSYYPIYISQWCIPAVHEYSSTQG